MLDYSDPRWTKDMLEQRLRKLKSEVSFILNIIKSLETEVHRAPQSNLFSNFGTLKTKAKQYRNDQIGKSTKFEGKIVKLLDELKKKYTIQKPIKTPTSFYLVDIFVHKGSICIEVDGKHHYEDEVQREKDQERDKFLNELGYRVVRIKNSQANHLTADALKKLLDKTKH